MNTLSIFLDGKSPTRRNTECHKSVTLGLGMILLGAFFSSINLSFAGLKGDIIVRPLGGLTLNIDGDFSDWPLEKFVTVAQQPVFPNGQNADATDARGDHLVFDRDRIGRFNDTPPNAWADGPSDFGVAAYFAYDAQFLYILHVFIDDVLRDDRDASDFGTQGYLNDGFEFFLDTRNNSDDCATDLAFPDFDPEEPNTDDLQVTIGLNRNFKPAGSAANVLGARQTVERSGDPDLRGPDKGGPGGIYRDMLDSLDSPDIAVRSYEDLRAAGARNPEILANPSTTFTGYAIELRIPFGSVTAFTPDHDMGFEIFWRDVDQDNESSAGGGNISWASWAQSTAVPCDDPGIALFNTANWAKLVFSKDQPLENIVSTAPEISITRKNEDIALIWEGTADLQWTSQVEESFADIFDATSPFPLDTTLTNQRFYRLKSELTGVEPALEPVVVFFDDLESGAQGWTHSGLDGSSDIWELGAPLNGPSAAFSESAVFGTDLDDDYSLNTTSRLRSPIIDLAGQTDVIIRWMEYRDIEPAIDGQVFDHIRINIRDANNPEGPALIEEAWIRWGVVRGWLQRQLEIGPPAAGGKIIIEFEFFSDEINDPPQAGWFIDDVAVLAQ
ncbi:MAG TPA: hypothetical protein EYQ50_26485 [Verrucomicrobiales bacterium]|nr:hypothetical protein [Verrucomicrobiales bacterium]